MHGGGGIWTEKSELDHTVPLLNMADGQKGDCVAGI